MNVANLREERRRRRKCYLDRHRKNLDESIGSFILGHLTFDLDDVIASYRNRYISSAQAAYNYMDMREELLTLFDRMVVDDLLEYLETKDWFERRFITRQMLAERCLSAFILRQHPTLI